MEITATLALICVFSFFFLIASLKRNYVLEWLCSIGFVVLGVLSAGTGTQVYEQVLMNTTSTAAGNVTTDVNVYGTTGFFVPDGNVLGWFLIFIGIGLTLIGYKTYTLDKKDHEEAAE